MGLACPGSFEAGRGVTGPPLWLCTSRARRPCPSPMVGKVEDLRGGVSGPCQRPRPRDLDSMAQRIEDSTLAALAGGEDPVQNQCQDPLPGQNISIISEGVSSFRT